MIRTMDDLSWIRPFVDKIQPYIHVRLTDNVLIRLPNEAYKLNETGARLLNHMIRGGEVEEILAARNNDNRTREEISGFFQDLSRLLDSRLCENYRSNHLERIPFTLGYIELPVLSEVAITWKCNIKCHFCYASCRCVSPHEKSTDVRELSIREIKRILNIIRHDAEVPSVSFTGGEPTLRPDLHHLIRHASRKLNMRVNLITNGTLITPAMARGFRQAGLSSAQVSIESPNPDIHDEITGVPGAFYRSVTGFHALKNSGISVHPHATICRQNAESLLDMPEFARSLGADRFSANLVIPAGRGSDAGIAVTYDEIGAILENLHQKADASDIQFMWYSPTPVCLFNPVSHGMGNKGCSACEGLLSIDPMGRVLPCSSWNEPVGDLLQENFQEIWFSNRAQKLRDKSAAHPQCHECEHFPVCHGACPLYFQVHGYGELEPILNRLTHSKTQHPRVTQ